MLFGQRMLKCRYGEYGNETVGQRTVIEPDGDGKSCLREFSFDYLSMQNFLHNQSVTIAIYHKDYQFNL